MDDIINTSDDFAHTALISLCQEHDRFRKRAQKLILALEGRESARPAKRKYADDEPLTCVRCKEVYTDGDSGKACQYHHGQWGKKKEEKKGRCGRRRVSTVAQQSS